MRRQSCALVLAWALSAAIAVTPSSCFAWGNAGHKLVVAIALQFDPTLRGRIDAVLSNLPNSPEWQSLQGSGRVPDQSNDKIDADAWVKSLADDPERAATFPDWAKNYNGYAAEHYDRYHGYDINYLDGGTNFVRTPNALTALPDFEQAVKTQTGGKQAWALAWVLSLVGDLHQPLRTTSRGHADDPNKSDHGGADITYEGKPLLTFWDNLPEKEVGSNIDLFAAQMVREFHMEPLEVQDALVEKAQDLSPDDWIDDGRQAIQSVGYPTDHKVTDYDDAALKVANKQLLLAGARLANLLNKLLPA